MNSNNGSLWFGAGIDRTQWRRDIEAMRRDILGLSQTTIQETRNMKSAFDNLGLGIAGVFSVGAIKSFAMEMINVRGEFQKTEIAFTTMLGNAGQAKILMGQMVKLAAETPFGLQDVSAGAKQLLAFQIPANQVVDTLTRMGNIAAGLGVPLSRINLVYGQVKAKGKLMGDDLRQFTEAGIPMVAELAAKFGKGEEEISAMVSAGKIGFKDVQDVLFNLTNEGGMFYQLMEKQSASLSGRIANLGDNWDQMLNKIGQSSEGFLYDGIDALSNMLENYQEVLQTIVELVAVYGTYKAAVIATNVIGTVYNRTIASEIALLGISDKMKLGRAMVTQRQAEASAREAAAEVTSTRAKYSSLQVEVSSLAIKKQAVLQSALAASAKAQEARIQLSLARMELTAIQATGTAREIEIVQKRVATAQNTVIATQETASIARKRALAASTEFNTAKQQLENTAQAVGIAEKTAATAAETAQIATKNANAIATTRLTVLQNIQTLATRAGAQAQAFLNSTLMANPYATVIVLLGVLTYSIYKTISATSELQKLQEKLSEDIKQTNASVNEQKTKIESLVASIKKQGTSYEEAERYLRQLNKITDNRISGLTVEAIKTGEADKAIQAYTKTLYRNAEAMLKVQEISKWEQELKDTEEDLKTFKWGEALNQSFNPFSADYWSTTPEKQKKERREALKKMIADAKKDVEKAIKDGLDLSTGGTSSGKDKKKGWAKDIKDQIEALEAELDSAPTEAAYRKIEAKIKALNERLNPKKDKKGNKQKAEFLPLGSPEQIQQQISLLDKAMALVENGMVKVRKLNEYGHDKNKDGNPYLTGEIISIEEAGKRREKLDAKYKEIQYKNFQERIDETKRQIEVRDKLLKSGYSKESTDQMFPEVKDKTFLQYLNETSKSLEKLDGKQSVENLTKIQIMLTEYTGTETFIENVNKQIDQLKSRFTGNDLIEKLEKFRKATLEGTTGDEKNSKNIAINKALEEERNKQREFYDSFVKDKETFEQRKLAIEAKYNELRKRIEDSNVSDAEKTRQTELANKTQEKDISGMSWEMFQKTDAYVKAFGDLEKIGPRTLKKIRDQFKAFLDSGAGAVLNAQDLKAYNDALKNLDDQLSKNPFSAITLAIQRYQEEKKKLAEAEKKYTKNSTQYNTQLDNTNFSLGEIFKTSQAAADATIGFASELGGALGMLSQESQEALKNAQQLFDGIINAVTGYLSGDYAKMAGGILQMITSISKAMNGDIDRSNTIHQWGIEIDKLKSLYEQLNKVIEKTAGESQLKMQRDLIFNLKEQQDLLIKMRRLENEKKGSDTDKIASYSQQIEDINNKIEELAESFKAKVTTIEFKDLAQKMADALVEAFGKGEDAAKSFDKVVDDVMRNAVQNALKMKFLDEAAENMVNQLYSAMGFGNGDTTDLEEQLKSSQDRLKFLENLINNSSPLNADSIKARFEKEEVEKLIASLKQQIASSNVSGNFDGLTQEERDKIKAMGEKAMKDYMDALKQYQDLFGQSAENAQGLKGDIKGITEKTAGALEGQINAMRIMQAEALKRQKDSMDVLKNQLLVQVQIEQNTRPLKGIYDEIKSMNSKIKNGLAGIP